MTSLDEVLNNLYVPLPQYDLNGGRTIITSPFGMRNGNMHYGVDFGTTNGVEIGTPVHPVATGKIVACGNAAPNSAGNFVWLLLSDDVTANDGSLWSVGIKYFHLNLWSCREGQFVWPDEVIAQVGNTYKVDPHTHVQVHVFPKGKPDWSDHTAINATGYFQKAIDSGRWPGTFNSNVDNQQPIVESDDEMALAVSFPVDAANNNYAVHVLVAVGYGECIPGHTAPDGFAWQWIEGPQNMTDVGENMMQLYNFTKIVKLAAGNDAFDALWNRYPVMNGPAMSNHNADFGWPLS